MTEPTVFIEYTSAPQNRQPFDGGNLQRCQETFLASKAIDLLYPSIFLVKGFLNKEMPQVKVLRTAFPIAQENLMRKELLIFHHFIFFIGLSQNNLHIEPFEVYVSDQLLFSRKKSGKWPNILVITSQIKKVIQEKVSLVALNDDANGNNFRVAKLPIIRNNSNHRTVIKVNKRKTKKPVELPNQTTITESNSPQLCLKQASGANILSESDIPKPEAVARAKSPLERRIKSSAVDDRKGVEPQSFEKENKLRQAKQKVGIERKHKRLDHKSNIGDVSLMQIKEKSLRTTLRKKELNETSKGWAKNLNTFQKLMDIIQGKEPSSSSKPQEKVFLKKRFRYKADSSAYSSLLHRSNSITITHFQEETSETISYKFLGNEDDDIKILQTPSLLNIALNRQKNDPPMTNQFSLTRSRSLEYEETSEKANPKTLFNFHQSFSPSFTKEKLLFTQTSNSNNPFGLEQSSSPQEEIRQTAEFGTKTLNKDLDDGSPSNQSSPVKSLGKKTSPPKKIKKIQKKTHLELSESSLSPSKQKANDTQELKKLESEARMIAFEHINNDASNLVFSSLGQIDNKNSETTQNLSENPYNFVSKKELNLCDKSFQFINSSRDLKETRFTPQFAPFQTAYN